MNNALTYRSDVDGLRAIAVAVVVLFHAGLPSFTGGYVGVDVFFVISGFLITSLIVREIDHGSFSIARFYERRVRRIFPALFVVCAVTALASSWVMSPMDLVDFAKSLAATAFFASNVYFWRTSDYFDAPAETKPLLHTWSLAVEEQYYVVVPLLLLVLAKLGVKRLGRVFWPLALASLMFGAWGVRAIPTSTFYLLPARFFEILAGGIVAVGAVPALRSQGWRDLTGSVGLALIGVSVVLYTNETLFPGDGALLPVVGAAMVVHAGASGETRVSHVLSSRPLVWLGLRSYSLYLWHWPLFALAKQALLRPLDAGERVALVLLSLALADLSFRFVETPFRKHHAEARASTRSVLAWSTVPMAVSAALAGALVVANGLPQRFPGFVHEDIARGTKGSGQCMLTAAQSKKHYDDDACVVVADDEGPRVLLWGDSLAGHFRAGLDAIASTTTSPGLTVVQYTATMCPPVFGWSSVARPHCAAFNQDVWRVVEKQRIDTVVLASRWQVVKGRRGGQELFHSTVRALRERGLKVVVVEQSPVFPADVQSLAARNRTFASDEAGASTVVHDEVNVWVRSTIADDDVRFIAPTRAWCANDRCLYRADGDYLFFDDAHFSIAGSTRAARALVDELTAGAAPSLTGDR